MAFAVSQGVLSAGSLRGRPSAFGRFGDQRDFSGRPISRDSRVNSELGDEMPCLNERHNDSRPDVLLLPRVAFLGIVVRSDPNIGDDEGVALIALRYDFGAKIGGDESSW